MCLGACINDTTCKLENCLEGDTICQNNEEQIGYIKTCSDGIYPETDSCATNPDLCKKCEDEHSCLNTLDTCGECKTGTYKCEDGYVYTCKNGLYDEKNIKICDKSLGVCAVENECVRCLTDSMICHYGGSHSYGRLAVSCEGGEKELYCPVSCNPTMDDCGECLVSAEPFCEDDENGIGHLRRCVEGQYVYEACDGVSCSSNSRYTECGICLNESFECINTSSGGQLKVCIGGGNEDNSGSLYSFHCHDGVACTENGCEDEPASMCRNIRSNAFNGTVISVQNQKASIIKTCESESCNPESTDCGNCNSGMYGSTAKCINRSDGVGVLNGCANGEERVDWVCKDPEGHEISCGIHIGRPYGDCGECLDGSIKCENDESGTGKITVCYEGYWTNPNMKKPYVFSCHEGVKCTANGCEDEPETMCALIQHPYTNAGNPNGRVIQIKDGKAEFLQVCSQVSCHGDVCGECYTGVVPPQCTDGDDGVGVLKQCVDGAYVESRCGNDASCKDSTSCN